MPPTIQEVLQLIVQADSSALQQVASGLSNIDTQARQTGQSMRSIDAGKTAQELDQLGDRANRASGGLRQAGDEARRGGSGFQEMHGHALSLHDSLDRSGEGAERLGGAIEVMAGHLTRSVGELVGFGSAAGVATQQLGLATEMAGRFPIALAPIAAGVATVAAGLGVAGIAVSQFLGNVGRINQLGQTFDLPRQQVLGLSIAMTRLGIDEQSQFVALTQLSNGMESYAQSVASGSKAVTPFALGLEQIGVSAQNVDGTMKPLGTLLPQIADGFQQANERAQAGGPAFNAAAVAVDIFGRSGARLVPLLEQGSAGLASANEEASKSVLAAAAAAAAWQQWTESSAKFGEAIDEVTGALGSQLAPVLAETLDRLRPVVEQFAGFAARAAPVMAAGIEMVANAFGQLFSGDFAGFGERMGAIINAVGTGLVNLAAEVAGHLPDFLSGLATLASQAGTWGYNLAVAFAQGLLQGAADAITAAITEIASLIASFFESFSPPKAGPLSTIDKWGANLIDTYLQGMSKADLSILDKVTGAIKDKLTEQMNLGEVDKLDVIPRLLGGEASLAQAISEIHEYGQASEEAIQGIADAAGSGAGEVLDLFNALVQLGDTESQISAVKDRIGDVEQSIRDLDDAERDSTTELKDSINDWDRYFDRIKSGYSTVLEALKEWIRVRKASYEPDMTKADAEVASAQVDKDKLDLQTAQGAPAKRIADETTRLAKVEAEIVDLNGKKKKSAEDLVRLTELNNEKTKLSADISKGAVPNEGERLDIATKIAKLAKDTADANQKNDTELQNANRSLATTQGYLEQINAQQHATEDPLKQNLNDIEAFYARQKEPLKAQLEGLQSQEQSLEHQKSKQEEIVGTIQARIKAEGDVAKEIAEQNKLLDEQAKKGGAGGGAGRAGGAGGIGALPRIGAGAGFQGLSDAERAKIKEGIDNARQEIERQLSTADFSGATNKLRDNIRNAVTQSVHGAFTNLAFDGALIGGTLGAIIGGGPLGAIVGAAIGAAIGKGVTKINWHDAFANELGNIGGVLGGALGVFFGDPKMGFDIGRQIGVHIADGISNFFSTHEFHLPVSGLNVAQMHGAPTGGTGGAGAQLNPNEPGPGAYRPQPVETFTPVPGSLGVGVQNRPRPELPSPPEPDQAEPTAPEGGAKASEQLQQIKSQIIAKVRALPGEIKAEIGKLDFNLGDVLKFVIDPGGLFADAIAKIKQAAGDLKTKVLEALGHIDINLKDVLKFTLDPGGLFSNPQLSATIGNAFSGLGSAASSALSGLGSTIGSAFSGIGSTVSSALSGIGTDIGTFFGSLPGLAEGGLSSLGDLWSNAMTALSTAAHGVWDPLATDWTNFISGLTTTGQGIATWISDTWSSAWSTAQTTVTNVISTVQTAWNNAVAALQQKGGELTSWLETTFGPAWNTAKTAAKNVADFLTTDVPNAFNAVANSGAVSALKGALSGIETALNNVKTAAQNAASAIQDAINKIPLIPHNIPSTAAQSTQLGRPLGYQFRAGPLASQIAPGDFGVAPESVTGGQFGLSGVGQFGLRTGVGAPQPQETGAPQQQGGGNAALAQIQQLQAAVQSAMSQIVAAVQAAMTQIEQAVKDSIGRVQESFTTGLQQVQSIAAEQLGALIPIFQGAGTQAGNAWASAVAQGIQDGSSAIGQVVRSLAQQMFANMLSALASFGAAGLGPGGVNSLGGSSNPMLASPGGGGKKAAGGMASGWFIAGDPGPHEEAVYAPGGAFVIPANLTKLIANAPHYAGGTDNGVGDPEGFAKLLKLGVDAPTAFALSHPGLDEEGEPLPSVSLGPGLPGGEWTNDQIQQMAARMYAILGEILSNRNRGRQIRRLLAGITGGALPPQVRPLDLFQLGLAGVPTSPSDVINQANAFAAFDPAKQRALLAAAQAQTGEHPLYEDTGRTSIIGPQSILGNPDAALAAVFAAVNSPIPPSNPAYITDPVLGGGLQGSKEPVFNLQAALVMPNGKIVAETAGQGHMEEQQMRGDLVAPGAGSK